MKTKYNVPAWLIGLVLIALLVVGCFAVGIPSYIASNWPTTVSLPNPLSNPIAGSSCAAPVDGLIAYDHPVNMDVGDPTMFSVVYASEKSNLAVPFVAIIGPKANLDYEAPQIVGNYEHYTSKDDAACAAKEMAQKLNVAVLFYVGSDLAPAGFIKYVQDDFSIQGWTLSETQYADTKIEVPGAVWTTIDLPMGDHNLVAKVQIYGQFHGVSSKIVDHFIVDAGYTLHTTNDHGTYWKINGSFDRSVLLTRFYQMSDIEVPERDHPDVINKYHCGDQPVADGFSDTLPTGWSCSKN